MNRQNRRLVVYVHAVSLNAVCAAQARGRVQPASDNPSGDAWWTATSSGQRIRVRVNRSGERQLNQALHLVVLTRLRYDPATRVYAQRRRAQGKTNREIRRCPVRYVARQLYRLLEATLTL